MLLYYIRYWWTFYTGWFAKHVNHLFSLNNKIIQTLIFGIFKYIMGYIGTIFWNSNNTNFCISNENAFFFSVNYLVGNFIENLDVPTQVSYSY